MRATVQNDTTTFRGLRVKLETHELVDELLRGFPSDAALIATEDDETIAYSLMNAPRDWKLRRIVFVKDSLRKLAHDADRDVKIDYIRRDLFRAATRRRQYVYPRPFAA